MQRLIAIAAMMLGACAPAAYAPLPPAAAEPQPLKAGCPVDTQDWAAWVNAMPGPAARPTLIVTGKATVPTGGWRFEWRDFRVMESYPVQVAVDLLAIPPSGGATQAVVTHEVRGEWPISPPVGALTVRCGGRTLAFISPVETAH